MNTPVRLMATFSGQLVEQRSKHYRGLPPGIVDNEDSRALMAFPAFVVVEKKADGVFLFCIAADGTIVGDTWHVTLQEAKEQVYSRIGSPPNP